MPSLYEAAKSFYEMMIDDEPKSPMHTGEVTALWLYLASLEETVVFEQAMFNMTNDDEVKELLGEAIRLCDSQAEQLKDFLLKEGVPLPSADINRVLSPYYRFILKMSLKI